DWALLDRGGHLVDWWELPADYTAAALQGRPWPSAEDYGGGDFDTFNETRRDRFAAIPPATLRRRGADAHERAVAVARQLPGETLRSDAAWGWVHQVLHGHALDHLTVLEPWADALRQRQTRNDPFGPDPQPVRTGLPAAIAGFWLDDAVILGQFEDLLTAAPEADWAKPPDG